MATPKTNKSQKLIQSHKKSRMHLIRLLDGLDEDMWFNIPGNGRWSIQRAATHIVNAELMWMSRRSGEEPQYLARDTTLDEFRLRQDRAAAKFRESLRNEAEKHGFLVIPPSEGKPSYHWSMMRTLQHAIYHTGMISLLRQQVGAPVLMKERDTWPEMVDSVFNALV